MPAMTGLSGNELYCLALKGYSGGDLVLGNSVHSLGFLGGLGSLFQSAFGGEVRLYNRQTESRETSPAGPASTLSARPGIHATSFRSQHTISSFHSAARSVMR